MDTRTLLKLMNISPSARLEDEALYIEKSGEMPEVAYEESVLALGSISHEEKDHLRIAVLKAYLSIIKRDLDPNTVGKSSFRGLGRAVINLSRLKRYLCRIKWPFPDEIYKDLSRNLADYLRAEKNVLERGRPYATANLQDIKAICEELSPGLNNLEQLLAVSTGKPVPDFLGLRALARLKHPDAMEKRMRRDPKRIIIELLDNEGKRLCGAAFLRLNPQGLEDDQARDRAGLVWSLLDYPLSGDSAPSR